MKDVVCAEAELSIAANKIVTYADFLANSIETYIGILDDIKSKGIQDSHVSGQLAQLAFQVMPYAKTLHEEAADIQTAMKSYMEGIEDADKFSFPLNSMSMIASLLAPFY